MPITSVPTPPGELSPFDLVQITTQGVSDGQQVDNVWYVSVPSQIGTSLAGSAAVAEMNAVAEAMRVFWGRWLLLLGGTLGMDQHVSKKVQQHLYDGDKGKFVFDLQGIALDGRTGSRLGEECTLFTAVTVALRSADSGRHYRGSKRFSPIVEADTENNQLEGAALMDWQTACSGALAGWDTAVGTAGCAIGWKLVVAQINLVKPPLSPPGAGDTYFSPITLFQVNQILGSQVSRKRKRHAA